MKLTIDFEEATDKQWEHFLFRQEGMKGLKLPGAYLPEFIEALEKPSHPERFSFWENYFVLNTKHTSVISVSTKEAPLLQLSSEQRAKLIAHLRSTYAALIAIYR